MISRFLILIKMLLQAVLRQFGLQLVRNSHPKALVGFSHGEGYILPEEEARYLTGDNPRLVELRARYKRSDLAMAVHTWWTEDYVEANLDLKNFRGDNAYVWQTRHMGETALQRYYLYLRDVKARDQLNLLSRFTEDGAFGAWVYRYHSYPAISRDLLDSVSEINFLERHAAISNLPELKILDIGAGYGRMAYRCCEALPNLNAYFCVDAVAESTFIAERYLQFRACEEKAKAVPLDELDSLRANNIDIAINVHSFSEMSSSAIEGWVGLIVDMKIPYLFVVPNDRESFLSMESDGTRRDFLSIIERHGFQEVAKESAIEDADIRELVGVYDHMFLFERKPA